MVKNIHREEYFAAKHGRHFGFEVSRGKLEGAIIVDKFGENPDIDTGTDPEDIWEGGGIYNFSTTDDITQISSSDNGDIVDIKIEGLDINGYLVEQTIPLNGQIPVTLSTPLWRVFRMENEGSVDIQGMVYLSTTGASLSNGTPTDSSTIRALINDGNNQTLMAIYTIPKGYTGYLFRGTSTISRNQSGTTSARMTYKSRRVGGIFKTKYRFDLVNTGSSSFDNIRIFPDSIPELTDIKIQCEETTSNDIGIAAAFDILLLPNE